MSALPAPPNHVSFKGILILCDFPVYLQKNQTETGMSKRQVNSLIWVAIWLAECTHAVYCMQNWEEDLQWAKFWIIFLVKNKGEDTEQRSDEHRWAGFLERRQCGVTSEVTDTSDESDEVNAGAEAAPA